MVGGGRPRANAAFPSLLSLSLSYVGHVERGSEAGDRVHDAQLAAEEDGVQNGCAGGGLAGERGGGARKIRALPPRIHLTADGVVHLVRLDVLTGREGMAAGRRDARRGARAPRMAVRPPTADARGGGVRRSRSSSTAGRARVERRACEEEKAAAVASHFRRRSRDHRRQQLSGARGRLIRLFLFGGSQRGVDAHQGGLGRRQRGAPPKRVLADRDRGRQRHARGS